MIKSEYVKCECPNCSNYDPHLGRKVYKKFDYPERLPHNYTPSDFKFFSITAEDRKRLKYSFILHLKDSEEITDLIHNLYFDEGIEAVEEFLEKAELTKKINEIVEKKRNLVITAIRQSKEFDKDLIKRWPKIQEEYLKAKFDLSYCLNEEYD